MQTIEMYMQEVRDGLKKTYAEVEQINKNYEEIKNNHLKHIDERLEKLEQTQSKHTSMLEAMSFNFERLFTEMKKISEQIKS